MKILEVAVIVCFCQENIISAKITDDEFKTLISRQERLSQSLNDLQKEIKELKTENKLQKDDIDKLKEANLGHTKNYEIQKEVTGVLQKHISNLEAESMRCSNQAVSQTKKQTDDIKALDQAMQAINKTTNEQETRIKKFLDQPEISYCSYKSSTNTTTSSITYDSLFYSNSNQPTGGLDINTGMFTSPFPGTYTVTWSLHAANDAGEHGVYLYLNKNGERVEEAFHYSHYTGPSGWVEEQGGMTLFLHLDLGETLSLYCEDCSAEVWRVMFCVTLTTVDYTVV